MAKKRLINCDFLNSGSFKCNVSNKAKLLYHSMIVAADDLGFVDTTHEIINTLEENDKIFNNSVSLELLDTTYQSALGELISKGYLYEFSDKHLNKVHLIRAWFLHNKWKDHLWTSYWNYYKQVQIKNGEYVMKPLKEDNNINQSNINQDTINQIMEDNEILEELEKSQPKDKKKTLDDYTDDEFQKLPKEEQKRLLEESLPM